MSKITCRSVFFSSLYFMLLSAAPWSAIAQTIGNWTFNNTLAGTPGSHNTLSVADFSGGVPTHSFNGGTEYFGESGWPSGAINTAMYLQFSLGPVAGYQADISTMILRLRRSNTGSPAGSGPTRWALRSSLDGYTTDIASGSMTHNYANYTVTPGSAFLNLYGLVSFRLYGYNASTGSGGNSRLVVDNISVNGISYLLSAKLGPLQAAVQQDKVQVSYTVYNTEKNSRYYIERSADGVHFTRVHTTEETDAAAEKQYLCVDNIQSLYGVSQLFYRVQLSGSSGMHAYSAGVVVNRKTSGAPVKAFISNRQLYIIGTFPGYGAYQVDLYTMAGQLAWHSAFTASAGYTALTIPVSTNIPASCIIKLSNRTGYSCSSISVNH